MEITGYLDRVPIRSGKTSAYFQLVDRDVCQLQSIMHNGKGMFHLHFCSLALSIWPHMLNCAFT